MTQWFKLTAPNGEPVWINPEKCGRVRPATNTVAKEAKTIIDGDFGFEAVTEDMEMVMKVLRKC